MFSCCVGVDDVLDVAQDAISDQNKIRQISVMHLPFFANFCHLRSRPFVLAGPTPSLRS